MEESGWCIKAGCVGVFCIKGITVEDELYSR